MTKVLTEYPAARAGLKAGDEILEIQGKQVAKMEEGEAQSLINSNGQTGLSLLVRGADKVEHALKLSEGAIYPLVDEDVPVD